MTRAPDAVDSRLGAGSRFLVEVTAWTAAPWAAAQVSPLLGGVVLVTLVVLPSVFNAPGDKQHTGIPVPGRVRIMLELLVMSAAILGATAVMPRWAYSVCIVAVAVAVVAGRPRWRWLATR